jgi:hypothetical protein
MPKEEARLRIKVPVNRRTMSTRYTIFRRRDCCWNELATVGLLYIALVGYFDKGMSINLLLDLFGYQVAISLVLIK